ncbi:MAG: site-specific integrase, partial [Nitrospinae bacterium]|nr:site-specific integrase [Nitrospinota bacterium]
LLRVYATIHDMRLNNLIDETYATLLTLYPKTGVRPSEGLGLQPGDIDFVGKTLRVCRSIEVDGTLKDRTKTETDRLVDLSDEMVATLRTHCERLELELRYRGTDEVPWLFPNEAGRPLDLAKVRKVFYKVLMRAGIHRHRVYDLRHTFASHLLNQGVPITYVAHQLGHSSPDVTLRWYGRWLPNDQKSYAHIMDAPPAHSAATSSATTRQEEAVMGSQVVETTRDTRVERDPLPADTIS